MPFLETVYRLINKYNQCMKTPRHYGTEELLYPAETHAIELIGSGDSITATRLAEKLGITKGAVSQTTSRLLEKGMILRQPAPGQKREHLLTLTGKGETVLAYHRRMHAGMLTEAENVFRSLPPEARQAFEQLAALIDRSLDEWKGDAQA
ncbi:MAG: MarR family transcriptional regulator [Clostridia bacterium]|nr:MarR family transcriptional regulator [Clostridia bacterium]